MCSVALPSPVLLCWFILTGAGLALAGEAAGKDWLRAAGVITFTAGAGIAAGGTLGAFAGGALSAGAASSLGVGGLSGLQGGLSGTGTGFGIEPMPSELRQCNWGQCLTEVPKNLQLLSDATDQMPKTGEGWETAGKVLFEVGTLPVHGGTICGNSPH